MPSPARSVIRSATRGNGPLNILTFPTHERYESNLAKTGHNFFSWVERNVTKPKWDEDYAAIPNNYTVLDPNRGVRQIPEFIDIDLVSISTALSTSWIVFSSDLCLGFPGSSFLRSSLIKFLVFNFIF